MSANLSTSCQIDDSKHAWGHFHIMKFMPFIFCLCLLLQAAELLRHPHLQAYVLNVHLKLNSPRRSSFPIHWPETDYINKSRFSVPGNVSVAHRERRLSSAGDRTLNPSISEADQDRSVSNKTIKNIPSCFDRKSALSVGSTHQGASITKRVTSKTSSIAKNPKMTPTKPSPTIRRQAQLSKNRELVSKKC